MLAGGSTLGLSLQEKLKLEDSADFRKINNNGFFDDHSIHLYPFHNNNCFEIITIGTK